jgi:hypothetical protein
MASRKFVTIPPYNGANDASVLRALVGAVSYVTAQTQPVIEPLETTATTAEIIDKVNEIIARLQGTT